MMNLFKFATKLGYSYPTEKKCRQRLNYVRKQPNFGCDENKGRQEIKKSKN